MSDLKSCEYTRRHKAKWKKSVTKYTRKIKHDCLQEITAEGEQWKIIEGTLGRYQISSHGRAIGPQGKLLKPLRTAKGYLSLSIYQHGIKDRPVHRLVAEAFVPNPLGLPCVNHKSGCKSENAACNLEWCTHQQNTVHALQLGLRVFVEGTPAKKLTARQVRAIRKNYIRGSTSHSQTALARKYKVSTSAIGDILLRKTWKDL